MELCYNHFREVFMDTSIKRGSIISVKITGIQPYGAFALLPDNSTGLIHISEISDKFVKSIEKFVNIDDIVKVKVLDFDSDNHAKLSLKAVNRRNRRSNRVYYKNPRRLIKETPKGFDSLAELLNGWIEKGIVEEKK